MVTDNLTNLLYLSNQLPLKHPNFYSRFIELLDQQSIEYKLLPNTKDIWAVDYMPIQIDKNRFVQFRYNPNYLQYKKWINTITNVDSVCDALNIKPIRSAIILDGGNVVKCADKVIMCDKVFAENPTYTRNKLITELENVFEVEKIYFVPRQPKDFTGHADGMIRFINSDTVLVNNYSKESKTFQQSFFNAINNTGLKCVELVYNPYGNQKNTHANGIYLNYLQMQGNVIVPTFNIREDDEALKIIEQIFPLQNVTAIDSNEIAIQGGILNCISWNIFSNILSQ